MYSDYIQLSPPRPPLKALVQVLSENTMQPSHCHTHPKQDSEGKNFNHYALVLVDTHFWLISAKFLFLLPHSLIHFSIPPSFLHFHIRAHTSPSLTTPAKCCILVWRALGKRLSLISLPLSARLFPLISTQTACRPMASCHSQCQSLWLFQVGDLCMALSPQSATAPLSSPFCQAWPPMGN